MRSKGRVGALAAVLLFSTTALGVLVSIAVNEATSQPTWPWPFDTMQHHPWRWAIISAAALTVLTVLFFRLTDRGDGAGDAEGGAALTIDRSHFDRSNVNQITGGRQTNADSYYETNYFLGGGNPPSPAEKPSDMRDIPGLPEFVPGTLHDRRGLLKRLETEMSRSEGLFVALEGTAGVGKTAITAELLRKAPEKVARVYLAARGYPGVNCFSVLERLAVAVADQDDRQLLVERLNDGESDVLVRLGDVLDQLGGDRVWLALDDAQDLFDTGSGEWRDETLGLLFDEVAKRPGQRIKILLVTTVRLPLARLVTERVTNGLPATDFPGFVATLAIPGAPATQLAALAQATRRHPRTAELVVGIQAIATRPAADPLDAASDAPTLAKTMLASLAEPQERVVRSLAVLDVPVRPAVLAELNGVTPGEMRVVLDELVRCRLVRRHDDHYYLPAGEAHRIAGAVPPGTRVAQRRRAAAFLENAAGARTVARLDDLEDAFLAVHLYVAAEEAGPALRLMAALDDRYLKGWGQTATLTPWLTRMTGGFFGFREQARYLMLAGRALAQRGQLAEAIKVIDNGVLVSAETDNTAAHLGFLVQLAAYYFRAGQVGKAAEQYQKLLDRSPAGHKGVLTAHIGLALCLTETGAFTEADVHLDAAGSVGPDLALSLEYQRALIDFERGQAGRSVDRLEQARDAAVKANARVIAARCDDLAAWGWLLRNKPGRATEAALRAYEVAERGGDPGLWSTSGTTLAIIELHHDKPDRAFAAANLATRYATGMYAAEAFAVKGVASLRRGDSREHARQAFSKGAELARELGTAAPGCYRPHEVEGLALAGLALLDPERGEQGAADAYREAKRIVDLPGAQFRRRELFGALTEDWPGDPLPAVRGLLF
ncbi:AAA family ATPase [Paractinoplanes rhizophilus]|uniref:AAA family ATPase n=1 Tax=Paractinoplanes rhizophilus TaxID=1416877 RepID=A0ABW2I2Y3_9ACTN